MNPKCRQLEVWVNMANTILCQDMSMCLQLTAHAWSIRYVGFRDHIGIILSSKLRFNSINCGLTYLLSSTYVLLQVFVHELTEHARMDGLEAAIRSHRRWCIQPIRWNSNDVITDDRTDLKEICPSSRIEKRHSWWTSAIPRYSTLQGACDTEIRSGVLASDYGLAWFCTTTPMGDCSTLHIHT